VRRSEILAFDALPVGAWVQVGDEGPLRVFSCTGAGPFTIVLTRVGWWRRVLRLATYWAARPRRWWLRTRCLPDRGYCWRRATRDCLCDRHWLRAVEDGGEYL
jgi:hypothetical protein